MLRGDLQDFPLREYARWWAFMSGTLLPLYVVRSVRPAPPGSGAPRCTRDFMRFDALGFLCAPLHQCCHALCRTRVHALRCTRVSMHFGAPASMRSVAPGPLVRSLHRAPYLPRRTTGVVSAPRCTTVAVAEDQCPAAHSHL